MTVRDFGSRMRIIEIGEVEVRWYDLSETTSTMDVAVECVKNSFPSWTCITAWKQTSGRGTHGREWLSPEGQGLFLSLILPSPDTLDNLENLSVRTTKIVRDCLREFYSLPYEIKKPNDLLIKGKKVAGVLYESVSEGDKIVSLILGMGVNLSQANDHFAQAGLCEATSLFIESGTIPDRDKILLSFLKRFLALSRKLITYST